MFNHFTDVQPMADLFKGLVDRTPGKRGPALKAISAFERYDWQPIAMEQALVVIRPDGFGIGSEGLTFTGKQKALLPTVRYVLESYVDILDGADGLFGTNEAAIYLGMKPETVKYHIKEGNLQGTLVGHSLVVTRRRLWEFEKEQIRRPRRVKETAQ